MTLTKLFTKTQVLFLRLFRWLNSAITPKVWLVAVILFAAIVVGYYANDLWPKRKKETTTTVTADSLISTPNQTEKTAQWKRDSLARLEF